jgi:hypothetical protein
MCRAILKCLIVVLALAPVGTLQAGPMALWLDPWEVTFKSGDLEGSVTRLSSNFGASATSDGQRRDRGMGGEVLPGTSAFARAVAAVKSGFVKDSYAFTQVDFKRQFLLQNSPNGWDVSLSGTLDGLLSIPQVESLKPRAYVRAIGQVIGGEVGDPLTSAVLIYSTELEYSGVSTYFSGASLSIVSLPDGIYTAEGSLEVSASINASLRNGGNALSNFFDGSNGFAFTVNATPRAFPIPNPQAPPPGLLASSGPTSLWEVHEELPVPLPEPGSLTLLTIGSLGLLGYGRARRKTTF